VPRRALSYLALAAGAVMIASACALTSCRSPTEITVVVTTDFDCTDLHHVTVTVGEFGPTLETSPFTSVSTTCAGGYAGKIVVVPSGANDDLVAIKVVGGFGKLRTAEDCSASFDASPDTPAYGAGCIVARRAIRYTPHTPLTVPVVLRAACDGVPCGETETCVGGACTPATIADPSQCTGASCDECTLVDGGCPPPPVYNDMTDPKNWSTFDPTTVTAGAQFFEGATFDGRYIYLAPWGDQTTFGSIVTRYDTQAMFGAAASWSTFDTSTVNAGAQGFQGAAFDGRYVYLVPNATAPAAFDGLVTRYDVHTAFGDAASWSTFDVTTVNAGAKGFRGATFDGRYLYLVPNFNGNATSGLVARYDTRVTFGNVASWSTFDIGVVNAGAQGFRGAVFDGRFVYFSPDQNGLGPDGIVARYDTQASFPAAASWSTFDTAAVHPEAKGFAKAAFDGRYVYFIPGGGGTSSLVAQYDTLASFVDAASWSTFDTTTVNARAEGFNGAAFDGRYVYLVPNSNGAGAYDGVIVRYDTQASFGAAASWSTFDAAPLHAGAVGAFSGAVFDGRYVYLVPYGWHDVARFDAKLPPSMPRGYSGSFF
jgi:hypothetical protein